MMRRGLTLAFTLGLLGALFGPIPAAPAAAGSGSTNMRHVANLQWRQGKAAQSATDIEFMSIARRDYAVIGTYAQGLQIVDITNPASPAKVGTYACGAVQGDVQVFRQGNRTLATYTHDDGYGGNLGGSCFRGMTNPPPGKYGTLIIDLSDPRNPTGVGFLSIPRGSHNATVHPSGQWIYNSDADLPGTGQIEVWDIRKPATPKLFTTLKLGPAAHTGVHDVTFSADGKRAYAAALTYSVVIDTSYGGDPKVLSTIVDPAINIHHQADPVTMAGPGGVPLTFVVVTDELVGGSDNVVCPGGGLHVYNVTGPLELAPVKVGVFEIPEVRTQPYNNRCTSHVLRMHPDKKIMTIAWYSAGVRVIDISNLIGVSAGVAETGSLGMGMREVGWYRFPNSETWSAKTNRIAADGSFFLFASDHTRGLDVFRYEPKAKTLGSRQPDPGRWMTPAAAARKALQRTKVPVGSANRPICILPKL